MAEQYELSIKIASDISDAIDSFKSLRGAVTTTVGAISTGLAKAGLQLQTFGKQVEVIGKQFSKLGKDLVRNVTVPLTALAAISLKKVFDEAVAGRGTAAMNQFGASVQKLKKSFDELTKSIGTTLIPLIQPLINGTIKAIQYFNNLDQSTKNIIVTIGAVAAVIGPIIVSIGAVVAIVGKLIFAFGLIATKLAPVVALLKTVAAGVSAAGVAVGALVIGLAGLINVFIKLRDAGVGAFEALGDAVDYVSAQFGSIIGGNLLKALSTVINAVGSLYSVINKPHGEGLKALAGVVQQLAVDSDKYAEQASKNINKKLAVIGTTAAEAFSFGLFGGIEKELEKEEALKIKLSPDIQRMAIETKFALQQVKDLKAANDVELQRLEAEHQIKMKELSSGETTQATIQERLSAETEYLTKKHALQLKEVEDERAKAIAIAQIEEDATKKTLAIKAAENAYKVELAKLSTQQELEVKQQGFAGEEELLRKRKEVFSQYADPAAQGLTDAFIDIADGSKTAEQAFNDFASSFIRQIAQMILKATLLKSINSAFGFADGGAVPAFANGGLVSGPGTGRSDSIPARLSNGEFVMTAKAVKRYGSNFFNNLNSASRGFNPVSSKIGHFADGGIVDSASAAPQVTIENSGSPKEVASTSFDPNSAVTTVILQDVQKNGPISKSLQNTFGVKRGGYR